MSKMFQIYEDDLADLEQTVAAIADSLSVHLDAPLKIKFRRCKTILSNVRWNYGPHDHVEVIPAGPDAPGDP